MRLYVIVGHLLIRHISSPKCIVARCFDHKVFGNKKEIQPVRSFLALFKRAKNIQGNEDALHEPLLMYHFNVNRSCSISSYFFEFLSVNIAGLPCNLRNCRQSLQPPIDDHSSRIYSRYKLSNRRR